MRRAPEDESGVVVSIAAYLASHPGRRSTIRASKNAEGWTARHARQKPDVESRLFAEIDECDDLIYKIDPICSRHAKQMLLACLSMCIDLALLCRSGDL